MSFKSFIAMTLAAFNLSVMSILADCNSCKTQSSCSSSSSCISCNDNSCSSSSNLCGKTGPIKIGIQCSGNSPASLFDCSTNELFGFDISLICELFRRAQIPFQFVAIPTFNCQFRALNRGDIDMIGNSNVIANFARLTGGAVVNNTIPGGMDFLATSSFQSTVFQAGAISTLGTVPGGLAFYDFVKSHPAVRVGATGAQRQSLLDNGISANQIVNPTSTDATAVINDICNLKLYEIILNDPATPYITTTPCTINLVTDIPYSQSQAALGSGYAFRKGECCQLILQLQRVLDQLVAEGWFNNFLQNTLFDARICAVDAQSFISFTPAPTPNLSIERGFVQSNCACQSTSLPTLCATVPCTPCNTHPVQTVSCGLTGADASCACATVCSTDVATSALKIKQKLGKQNKPKLGYRSVEEAVEQTIAA